MATLGRKGKRHKAAKTVLFRNSNHLFSVGPSCHTRAHRPPRVPGTGRVSAASERFGATYEETCSLPTRRTHARRFPGPLGALGERRGRVETCACRLVCQTLPEAEGPLSLVSDLRASVPGDSKCATRCPGDKEKWHLRAAKGKAPSGGMDGHLGHPAGEPRAFVLIAETSHLFQKMEGVPPVLDPHL